jgi:hypothetical protein
VSGGVTGSVRVGGEVAGHRLSEHRDCTHKAFPSAGRPRSVTQSVYTLAAEGNNRYVSDNSWSVYYPNKII